MLRLSRDFVFGSLMFAGGVLAFCNDGFGTVVVVGLAVAWAGFTR